MVEITEGDTPNPSELLFNTLKWLKSYTYINCWHKSEHESEAMWKLYSKNIAESLVIKTNITKLSEALPQNVRLEPVAYANYESDYIMSDFFMAPFKTKRIAFSHEKEFRIIYQEPPLKETDDNGNNTYMKFDRKTSNAKTGKTITLRGGAQELIEEIRLSPLASSWFEKLIKDLLIKYNLNIPVKKSEISIKPFNI